MSAKNPSIIEIYRQLYKHFGPLEWWPAESPFEVVIGAILTQNTAWTNVEMAIQNLRRANSLTPAAIAGLSTESLELLIRPAGFFRQKALRLKTLSSHLLTEWQGDLIKLCAGPLDEARERLLALSGVGPETADSILLYAVNRPSFVVDAYTRRIFERLGLLKGDEPYETIRDLFMNGLPEDTQLFNEYHAQIVELAKSCCYKRKPACGDCPIAASCCYALANKDQ